MKIEKEINMYGVTLKSTNFLPSEVFVNVELGPETFNIHTPNKSNWGPGIIQREIEIKLPYDFLDELINVLTWIKERRYGKEKESKG